MRNIKKKENLYFNGAMEAPDGTLLARVSKKVLDWYLTRNLAVKMSENPLVIRLNFQPKGVADRVKNLLCEMSNQCVVCGSSNQLTKHHVVPRSFRIHFPSEIKSHFSHDVLMLCLNCHERYERHSDLLRQQLRDKHKAFNISIYSDKDKSRASGYAGAILKHGEKIPDEKKVRMKEFISQFADPNDPVALQKLADFDDRVVTLKLADKKIVSEHSSLDEFMIMWRKHFVDCMKPQFLPNGWNPELTLGV